MKRLFLPVPVMLWVATATMGQTPPPETPSGNDGLIRRVVRNYGSRIDPADPREKRASDTPVSAPSDGSTPASPMTPEERASTERLDAQIGAMEKFVAERRREIEALNGPKPPIETTDTLKRRLASLRERSVAMGEDYVNIDRDAARAMVEKVRRFEAGFEPHVAALREGKKPDAVPAAEWAEMVDRFQAGQGRLDRGIQKLKERLHYERREALVSVDTAIGQLQRQLDALEDAGPEVRQRLTRQEAEIAVDLAERRLAELRQIRQEYEGQPSTRRNETTGMAPVPDLPPRGGGLAAMIEGIADQLKASGSVPEVGGQLGDPAGVAARGTPGAENLDPGDILRGQMLQLSNDLRNYHDQLSQVRAQVIGEEEDDLEARRSIEYAKRPVLPFEANDSQRDEFKRQTEEHGRQMEETLAELRASHQKVRDELIARRSTFLTSQIARTKERLEEAGRKLEEMQKEPAPPK